MIIVGIASFSIGLILGFTITAIAVMGGNKDD